jgi:hypothetical protein
MNVKALYRCTDCGHEQTVTEIHTEDGSVYVGSGANWCDECMDGLPERVEPREKTLQGKMLTQEHHDYLIQLRDSGETNMWGAAPYIERYFGVSRLSAKTILLEWIEYMSGEK